MKKLISMIAVAALLITGCAKELKVTPAENIKAEYGDKLDNTKLFNAKESDENVKVDKVEGFDAKKLGEQEITVTFTDGKKDKEEKLKIIVEDSKKPVIELKNESITITAGDRLELQDNIKSVKDSVDGDLKYSDKTIEKDGYYIDKGKLDTKKAGTYEVKVIAVDVNGNKSEKVFNVIVKKKETKKKSLNNPNKTGNFYTNNDSINSENNFSNNEKLDSGTSEESPYLGNSESSSGGEETRLDSNPHQHSITVTGYSDVVYSGVFFENEYECDTWASNYWGPNGEWSARGYSSKQCSCGMWSPYFFHIDYWN